MKPALEHILLGSILGGGAGALSSSEDRLQRALYGMLAGGALGGAKNLSVSKLLEHPQSFIPIKELAPKMKILQSAFAARDRLPKDLKSKMYKRIMPGFALQAAPLATLGGYMAGKSPKEKKWYEF